MIVPLHQTEIEFAIETLQKALINDSEYRRVWQANIAVAFQDECAKEDLYGEIVTRQIIHKVSKNAAERFIQNLTL